MSGEAEHDAGLRPSVKTEATQAAPHRASGPSSSQSVIAAVYEPLFELAVGGMARVSVGRRLAASGFERLVVIKQVHRHHLGNADFHDFFCDEARIASLIHHANVVPVIDVIDQPDELVLVGEYVESAALSLLTRHGGALPLPIALRIALDVLAGLHAAHELVDVDGRRLEVVHRDVSPQNILVGVDGVSRVIDFGIAKAEHRVTETESGHIKGKTGYMAPEQVQSGLVDRRSDLFSLGVVLHEVLSGERLFVGENGLESLQKVLVMPVPPLTNVAPHVDAVIQRALERDASKRYATAPELSDALERCGRAATPREVAQLVASRCGALLQERRERLAEARRSSVAPVTAASSSLAPMPSPSGSNRSLDAAATIPPPSGLTHVATSLDASPSFSKPRASRALWLVLVVVGLAAAIGVALVVRDRRAAAQPSSANSSQSAEGTDIALDITADAPIKGISAPGLHRTELTGSHGRVYLAPWSGEIAIEAQLADNRSARATVRVDGPRTATLVAVATATAVASAPPTGAPSPPTTRQTRPPVRPPPPPPRGADLHDNPY